MFKKKIDLAMLLTLIQNWGVLLPQNDEKRQKKTLT